MSQIGELGSIRPMSEARQRIVGENPKTLLDKIEEFRAVVKSQPHLKSRTSDQFLVAFLRNAKYDLKKALNKLDSFYAIRNVYPNIFKNRNIFKNPKIRELLDGGTGFPLPPGNSPGPAIFIGRWGAFDPKKYSLEDVCFVGTIGHEISAWENDDATIFGAWVIFDLANTTEAHAAEYTYDLFRKYYIVNPEMTPIEIKGFHFINTSPLSKKAVEIGRNVVNDSLKDKIYDHGSDLESLYKFVPKERLPVEYGGPKLTFPGLTTGLTEVFAKYADYFDEDQEMFGTNEKLRKGDSPIVKYLQ